jgi:hypothetical protein
MVKYLFLIVMILLAGCSSNATNKTAKEDKEKIEKKNNVVDPDVLSRVEDMGKYLRGLKKFEVSAKSTFDIVLEEDQKSEFEAKVKYKVKRPDKLFAEIKSDRKNRQYYYNGKMFTIYSPKEKFYGELEFKGTVGELIKKLNDFGIEVPLSDLFAWGTEEAKAKKVTTAIPLDKNHYAIRQEKIDWQVWLKEGKNPLPEKVLYEVNDDKARPKMSSTMNWEINPGFGDSIFEFMPPKGSQKIKLNPARKPEEKK